MIHYLTHHVSLIVAVGFILFAIGGLIFEYRDRPHH